MSSSTEQQAAELFKAALSVTASDRAEFVLARCGPDSALRARVQRLLALDENDGTFLSVARLPPATGPSSAADAETVGVGVQSAPVDATGERIGPYRLLRQIGEGGCGSVGSGKARE